MTLLDIPLVDLTFAEVSSMYRPMSDGLPHAAETAKRLVGANCVIGEVVGELSRPCVQGKA